MSGGTFSLQATAPGTYILYAQGGNCSVSGNVAIPGQFTPVCLGTCAAGTYKVGLGTESKAASALLDLATQPFCQWNVHGCVGTMFTGSGNVFIADSQRSFITKKDATFTFNPEISVGSNHVLASPALPDAGWTVRLSAGQMNVENVVYPSLGTSLQVDESALQTADGFCDKRDNLIARMTDY